MLVAMAVQAQPQPFQVRLLLMRGVVAVLEQPQGQVELEAGQLLEQLRPHRQELPTRVGVAVELGHHRGWDRQAALES